MKRGGRGRARLAHAPDTPRCFEKERGRLPTDLFLVSSAWPSDSLARGVPPPYPAWGAMLSGSGRTYMFRAPWMAIWPGVAISLAVFGFNMLGDALRDVLDPRLRGGR